MLEATGAITRIHPGGMANILKDDFDNYIAQVEAITTA